MSAHCYGCVELAIIAIGALLPLSVCCRCSRGNTYDRRHCCLCFFSRTQSLRSSTARIAYHMEEKKIYTRMRKKKKSWNCETGKRTPAQPSSRHSTLSKMSETLEFIEKTHRRCRGIFSLLLSFVPSLRSRLHVRNKKKQRHTGGNISLLWVEKYA